MFWYFDQERITKIYNKIEWKLSGTFAIKKCENSIYLKLYKKRPSHNVPNIRSTYKIEVSRWQILS